MKKLVLTISVGGSYDKISKLTHPTLISYAKKIGADFLSISDNKCSTPHWEKFQIYDLLKEYDRIIYLDTDLIVNSNCPDLFDLVPEDSLGMFEEGQFTDRSKELMIDICNKYDIKIDEWDGKYYNSGVMVISKVHQKLFKKPEVEYFSFYEQTYLNVMIAFLKIKIYGLHYRYNRMSCMDRFIGEDRHSSFVIHYAGFLFNISLENLLNLIVKDIDTWKQNGYNYKYEKHILVMVNGGLGDQICAEPAIRFMKTYLYPNDDFVVSTHYTRIFSHLKKLGVIVCEHNKVNLRSDTPYFVVNTLPGPETINWSVVSHLLCHTVDYSSMALMKRMLPSKDKHLMFELKNDHEEFSKYLPNELFNDNLVIIHPGKHWETKTFPVEYWQSIMDGLSKVGKIICVIGKDEKGDPPDFITGARGTVNVVCKSGMYDLRNKLSIGGLAALLSKAKILISNDSAPIHLAGAFDNWIVLLPSCKHPDHILPYRNSTTTYKTLALYKRLVIDEVESRPTQVYPTSVDIKIKDWNNYLLNPEDVVAEVLKIQ